MKGQTNLVGQLSEQNQVLVNIRKGSKAGKVGGAVVESRASPWV